ncbi:hypothetical protein [Arenibaculum pallidiluteum]|uniref:hypothetical protein n=1 Tax=Arenibaculum pallidiluteum TaxID=2812559 RepID=UPI001A96F023|nr:hypothetical protein [Arenibaculum pallidiluteum]
MKAIATGFAILLVAGSAIAGEGTPNPIFPGGFAVAPGTSAAGLADTRATAGLVDTNALASIAEPAEGPTRYDAIPAYDAPAQRSSNFDPATTGPFSRQ